MKQFISKKLTRYLRFTIIFVGYCFFYISSANADMRICNQTKHTIGVAFGYKKKEIHSSGWWKIQKKSCHTILNGKLDAIEYYIYAVDYEKSGEWTGTKNLCTTIKSFSIVGNHNCGFRGYDISRFITIKPKNKNFWTINLRNLKNEKKT